MPHQPGHPATDLPDTATAPAYTSTFRGRAEETARVRREIADYLNNCPAADDMILIASELAANGILHSRSRGNSFRVRCHCPRRCPDRGRRHGRTLADRKPDDRPHGLDIIQALTGQDGWGTQVTSTGGRLTWARLSW